MSIRGCTNPIVKIDRSGKNRRRFNVRRFLYFHHLVWSTVPSGIAIEAISRRTAVALPPSRDAETMFGKLM